MQIQLFDLSSFEGKSIHEMVQLEQDVFQFRMGTYPIVKKEPFELTITNIGNKVLELSGEGSITVEIPCGRCLKPVTTEVSFQIERKLDMKLTDEERREDLDECTYLNGTDLNVDQLIYLEVLMNWPLRVLCKENCKGICSQCGTNLNTGSCNCADQPKDPRMAAISDIFRKFKEEV